MPEPTLPRPRGPPTRDSTPVGGTRHASNQHARLETADTVTLLEELHAKSLVPSGGEATVENLANALIFLSKQKELNKNTSAQITLKSIATLLKVATDPFDRIQAAVETAVETKIGGAMKRMEESVRKLAEELAGFKAEYTKSSTELAEKVSEARAGAEGAGEARDADAVGVESLGQGGEAPRRSFAAAVGRHEKPVQAVTNRLEKQDRQILLDCESVEVEGLALKELPELSLVLKANLAMEALKGEMITGKPEGAKFRSANVLQNGGVVYEMNSKEAADWIKRPDVCAAFADGFGPTVTIKERNFPVVVECIPVQFDTSTKHAISRLEHDNNLPAGSISSGRNIRPPARRSQGQQHAHVVLQFKTKDSANLCIKNPIVVEGKLCDARKLAKKPVRCTKCQKYGHATKKCNSPVYECGTCLGQHNATECNDRQNTFCKTCKTLGHPTWDTKCPGYYAECESFATRVPDNLYKYYLTRQQWSWEKITDAKPSITTAPPFQPTATSFSHPSRPRGPQPPPFGRYACTNTTNSNAIPIPDNT
jgi:hypothetical protein